MDLVNLGGVGVGSESDGFYTSMMVRNSKCICTARMVNNFGEGLPDNLPFEGG